MMNVEKQSVTLNPLVGLGLFLLGVKVLDSMLEPHDTINYYLKYRGRIVYHGICYEDRFDARMREHSRKGRIIYDECMYGSPTTRNQALTIERKRIDRDCPKYNNHHNWKYSY